MPWSWGQEFVCVSVCVISLTAAGHRLMHMWLSQHWLLWFFLLHNVLFQSKVACPQTRIVG